MKHLFFVSSLFLLTACSGEIKSSIPLAKKEESLKIDVFSLTYHTQIGSCASMPVKHRTLVFNPVYLAANGTDVFVGSLDVLLDEQTKTYQALYREFPGAENPDQSVFETSMSGSFEVVKATNTSANDKMILQNLGEINPTITSNKVNFTISMDGDINRVMTQSQVQGGVRMSGTPLIDDNCLL